MSLISDEQTLKEIANWQSAAKDVENSIEIACRIARTNNDRTGIKYLYILSCVINPYRDGPPASWLFLHGGMVGVRSRMFCKRCGHLLFHIISSYSLKPYFEPLEKVVGNFACFILKRIRHPATFFVCCGTGWTIAFGGQAVDAWSLGDWKNPV